MSPESASEGNATVTKRGPEDRAADDGAPPGLDTTVANPARVWNYWVGGKDNFAVDREVGQQVMELLPAMPMIARYARRFLFDAVRRLSADEGIRQLLDIGTGLPTADNTHEVAQRAAPEARIVYVDNDPVVLAHARALLTSSPEGKTGYVAADLRDTDTILSGAEQILDFSKPIAVLLIAILHFIPDADDPQRIVARLMDAVPSGSYLAIVHAASDIQAERVAEGMGLYNQTSSTPITMRTRAQVACFFDGLDLVRPGVVPLDEWWTPDQVEPGAAGRLAGYAGIARKP
jgi:O-methyltransferase involved in polyketide biosynthesis